MVPTGTIVGDMETRKRVHISLTPALYDRVKERADAIGIPVAAYIGALVVVDINPPIRAGVRPAKEKTS
jgi:hypothetical protein